MKRFMASIIAMLMVLSSFSIVAAAEVSELTFKKLGEKAELKTLSSVTITKTKQERSIEIKNTDEFGYTVVLVSANKKTQYISNERVTSAGVYAVPKKIGSDEIKEAYLMKWTTSSEVDATKISGAAITGWYSNNTLLDTSVDFDFDELDIADISLIKFTLFDGSTVIATRTSKGKNLETLLKDCAPYWGSTAEKYQDVKGTRTLSCAFKTRTEVNDNTFWVSSVTTLAYPKIPTKILVEVLVGNTVYTSTKTY